jgi:septum formation protein
MLGSIIGQLNKMDILLATKSQPRREILTKIGFNNFKLVDSGFPENIDKSGISADEYVTATCKGKFESFIQNPENKNFHFAFFFDTITVDKKGNIFEKPKDAQAHFDTIKAFSGDKHYTMTYFVIAYNPSKLIEFYGSKNCEINNTGI